MMENWTPLPFQLQKKLAIGLNRPPLNSGTNLQQRKTGQAHSAILVLEANHRITMVACLCLLMRTSRLPHPSKNLRITTPNGGQSRLTQGSPRIHPCAKATGDTLRFTHYECTTSHKHCLFDCFGEDISHHIRRGGVDDPNHHA